MYHSDGIEILAPDAWTSGQNEIVYDTTFVLDKHEFLKVESSLNANYTDGMLAKVYFGLVGSEQQYATITGNHSGNNGYENFNPQALWNIPIQSEWVGQNVRLYIEVSNSGTFQGYLTRLFIWGK